MKVWLEESHKEHEEEKQRCEEEKQRYEEEKCKKSRDMRRSYTGEKKKSEDVKKRS